MTIAVTAHMPEPTATISPIRLSHYLVRTTRYDALKEWYKTVLGAAVVFESDRICLLTFDTEHHRVAILRVDGDHAPLPKSNGIEHVAFSYASLGDLVSTYERLKGEGIVPTACTNHGPTTSIYYSDPDGNHLELLTDNFASVEALQAWFETGVHEAHPGGVAFDPDGLARRLNAGVPERELLKQGSTD
jgi:catechol-2,3-dioxygenase